jgi:hypothetical protein
LDRIGHKAELLRFCDRNRCGFLLAQADFSPELEKMNPLRWPVADSSGVESAVLRIQLAGCGHDVTVPRQLAETGIFAGFPGFSGRVLAGGTAE